MYGSQNISYNFVTQNKIVGRGAGIVGMFDMLCEITFVMILGLFIELPYPLPD